MKNKLSAIIGIILMCAVTLFTCTGCTGAYAVKVDSANPFKDDSVKGAVDTGITTITIGNSSYNVKWSKSVRYESTDELVDIYEVTDDQDNSRFPGKIYLDPKTGEVTFFLNVEPYPAIENADTLSDDELKAAAERLLGDLADFSQYNVFEVRRPTHNNGNTDISLSWQVKRDILCDISVGVTITKDGIIDCFSKTDACPDGTAESFVPKEERIKLLEAEICRYLGVKSINNVNYEIFSETLSLHHNEGCVFYWITIIDKAGFSELVSFRVCKR